MACTIKKQQNYNDNNNDSTMINMSYASPKSDDLTRRRRIKCCGIAIAVVVVQVVILGVLALTVFRFKDPEIKLVSTTVKSLSFRNYSNVNMTLKGEILVKNKNWGEFKYEQSDVVLSYGSVRNMAEGGVVPSGRVKMRSTTRVGVELEAQFDGFGSSRNTDDVDDRVTGGDVMSMGVRCYVELSGKVKMLRLFKKRRTGILDCIVTVNLARQTIQEFECQ